MFLHVLHGEFPVLVFARTVELVMVYDAYRILFDYVGLSLSSFLRNTIFHLRNTLAK